VVALEAGTRVSARIVLGAVAPVPLPVPALVRETLLAMRDRGGT
jgi:hypothetical protein